MTLLLREDDVRRLLPMTEAIRLVREALGSQKGLGGQNLPRRRLDLSSGRLNVMAAGVPTARAAGLKAYAATRSGTGFLVALWDVETGQLLSLMEADWLGRIRTGAASGVATDALAPADAGTMALVGAGGQAFTQLQAVASVRTLSEVRVASRSPQRAEAFSEQARTELGLEVRTATNPREAVEGARVVTTITTSATPVVQGDWLEPGTHVNAAGSNQPDRRELDGHSLGSASIVAVDSLEQAREEAGDVRIAVEEGHLGWDDVVELGAVLCGDTRGRQTSSDITVFKSLGIATEDVAVARFVYDRARESGIGEETTFGSRSR